MSRKKKAIVAMSGGVDSTVAAALLKDEGYEVIGVTYNLWQFRSPKCERSIGPPAVFKDAKRACEHLGIEWLPLSLHEPFYNKVVRPFIDGYVAGKTPNPCALCNPELKFKMLQYQLKSLHAEIIATGHYARVLKNEQDDTFRLFRGVDKAKDQSYFLYGLTQPILQKLRFPLGALTKTKVRELAWKYKLFNAARTESQDVCFITDGSYVDLVAQDPRLESVGEGDIVDSMGNTLGHHEGYYRYTIGQRKGLGVAAAEPLYVLFLDADNNRVVVGPKSSLYHDEMIVDELSLCAEHKLASGMKVDCQIRSRHHCAPANLHSEDGSELLPGQNIKVRFQKAQKAIAPGQAAVFYRGSEVIGGGWIREASCST